MPSSPNKGYTQPAFNTEVGTWGSDLNNNFSGIVDNNLGGVASISLSNTNVTLTSTQAQNLNIFLTGTLLANVTVITPCIGFFFVVNNTTGSFAVSLQANFGSGNVGSALVIPQGMRLFIACDTTNGVQLAAAPAVGTPAGVIQAYAGSSAPVGWLLCYGQAVSRTIYAALFTAISTTYGIGDGSTTFNVPDLRGRAVFGLDNMGGSAAGRLTGSNTGNISAPTTLGSTGGEENHTSLTTEMPSHTHTDSGHTHGLNLSTSGQLGFNAGLQNGGIFTTLVAVDSGNGLTSASGTANLGNTGGGGSHNTTPPAMVMNVIIKY